MWIWDKLTKAKIVRTKYELIIKKISLLLLIALNLPFIVLFISALDWVSFIMTIIFFFITIIIDYYSEILTTKISKNSISIKSEHGFIGIGKPFFIDLLVKSNIQGIKIKIIERNRLLRQYTLKNTEDLTLLIDGLIELLDVELVENIKLSNSELLNFRSKNTKVAIPTDLSIKQFSEVLLITSIKNKRQSVAFNFKNSFVEKNGVNIDITTVSKILITIIKRKLKIEIQLFSEEKIELFKHHTTEINVIRDSNRLLETLENRQELQGIEIELIEKS